jgi:hypothetical protein
MNKRLNAIEKSERIISGLLEHDSEDPCVHTFAEILDSIFDNKRETSDTNFDRDVSDSISHENHQDEIV